jgi:uncharacterized protein DUF4336
MLQRIGEEIWSYERDIELPGGVRMPGRSTVLRLAGGALVVHAPLPIDETTATEIAAIGDVRLLVAPNRLHWMFLKSAKERYPDARVLGAPGLEKKLGSFPFEPLPARGTIDGIGEALSIERIDGAPSMSEHAFFHAPSSSLIVTDLIFNVRHAKGFLMNVLLRAAGAHEKTAQSRAWRLFVKDRAAAGRSASRILAWDFRRVVMAHGDVVSEDARERTLRALAWMTAVSGEGLRVT